MHNLDKQTDSINNKTYLPEELREKVTWMTYSSKVFAEPFSLNTICLAIHFFPASLCCPLCLDGIGTKWLSSINMFQTNIRPTVNLQKFILKRCFHFSWLAFFHLLEKKNMGTLF